MTEEIVIAGFGGQGVLSMGMILCYSGITEDKEVSWMPSYGPEMRGGTANCIAIVSDKKISSPIIARFDTVIALNQTSLLWVTVRPSSQSLAIIEYVYGHWLCVPALLRVCLFPEA